MTPAESSNTSGALYYSKPEVSVDAKTSGSSVKEDKAV